MPAQESEIREEICRVGKRLYDKELVAGTEGNISFRLAKEEFLITPAGVCKGTLTPGQLVAINRSGRPLKRGLKPSSEYRLHLFGYSKRPDFQSAVHAHATYATAFALAGCPIFAEDLSEFSRVFGDIPIVPSAEPGTKELARSIEPWIADHHTFLLEGHGIIAFGSDLWEAYYRVETAEHCAKILWLAGMLVASSASVAAAIEGLATEPDDY